MLFVELVAIAWGAVENQFSGGGCEIDRAGALLCPWMAAVSIAVGNNEENSENMGL